MGDFRRIVSTALIAGLLAGLWLSVARQAWVIPLILQAEELEHAATPHTHGPTDGAAVKEDRAPAEGRERNAWTWAANVLAAFGFALLLVALMVLARRPVSAFRGLGWGLAGFAVFSLVPAFGLPPALPGTPEGPVAARQLWWLATVLCSAAGLYLLVFARGWWRLLGVPLLVLPHLVGAPHATEPLPAALADLTRRFIAVTLAVNAIGWLLLGAITGWLWRRATRHPAP